MKELNFAPNNDRALLAVHLVRVKRTGSPEFAERCMSGLRLAGFE